MFRSRFCSFWVSNCKSQSHYRTSNISIYGFLPRTVLTRPRPKTNCGMLGFFGNQRCPIVKFLSWAELGLQKVTKLELFVRFVAPAVLGRPNNDDISNFETIVSNEDVILHSQKYDQPGGCQERLSPSRSNFDNFQMFWTSSEWAWHNFIANVFSPVRKTKKFLLF